MSINIEAYLKATPGGMSVLMDLFFHEECDPDGETISSCIGMHDEYLRMKDILDKDIQEQSLKFGSKEKYFEFLMKNN